MNYYSPGGFRLMPPVVKNLLIINGLLFLASTTLYSKFGLDLTQILGLFYFESEHFRWYQFITHMFMHGNFMHILFNMMALFFLGPHIERVLGEQRFLLFYLICGFAASGLHLLLYFLGFIGPVSIVGASGAIMGVAIAFAILYPNIKLMLLFPPIPIKAKYLVGAYILFDLFSGFGGANTGIAHFAHLGGAIGGFLLMNIWGYFDWRRFK